MTQIHVDVDNLWVYENEYGIDLHRDRSLIYTQSLPLALKLFKKNGVKVTFFIIGQDLKLKTCREFCKKAVRAGHKIGNHTWSHSINFGRLSFEEKKLEITKAHTEIFKVTGKRPQIFRGPGYFVDDEVRSILKSLHYRYDSSVLPGFAQILMKTFAMMRGGENKTKIFGRAQDIFSPSTPYTRGGLTELPISVLPMLHMPIHTTFVYAFGLWYREHVLKFLKSKPKHLIYTFHAIDFIDIPKKSNDFPIIPLRFSLKERVKFMEEVLELL